MRILLITNPTAFRWSPHDKDAWGGGEEAVTLWAEAMWGRGHDIVVVYDGEPTTMCSPLDRGEPIMFIPRGGTMTGPFDVAIYRKCPELYDPTLAPVAILWTDQNRGANWAPFRRIVLTSPYLRRVQESAFPITADKLVVLPDGYDPSAFPTDVVRDPNLVLHASSPDRGLVQLLEMWPAVVAARPNAFLRIAYGWDLFTACGGNPALREDVERRIEALNADHHRMRDVARSTVDMDRESYAGIHTLFKEAGVWAYYCTGGEGFCQTAVKAQMAGAVPVVRPWGALHDTVWSGLKADTPEAFTAALIDALDPERQAELRSQIAPMAPDWDTVAEAWDHLLSAAEPPAPTSRLVQVPDTPNALLPNPALHVPQALQQLLESWATSVQARRPWVEPSLAVSFPPLPPGEAPDAYVVGWVLEDSPDAPALTLHRLNIPKDAAVLVLTTVGNWRAQHRHRQILRHDLDELFGRQPQLQSQAFPLDGEGNAITATSFRWDPHTVGSRDLRRVRSSQPARETLSVCFMAPKQFDDAVFLRALRSWQPIADQVCVALNGPELPLNGADVRTADLVERWSKETGIPAVLVEGTNPRWCFDCSRLHDVGELQPGHRVAGFETPRNQSIAAADGDFIAWSDSDEELQEAERLAKYLRPNIFQGYGLNQDHFSSDPPQAFKRDTPVRIFRRHPEGVAGWTTTALHDWPTYHSGLTARFAGIVHEHPGHGPQYTEGLGPVLLLPDLWLAHSGYFTEVSRRKRFLRNWPLMVADRAKYPERRLGQFLWLRDLSHHVRYLLERNQGQVTADVVWCAEEAVALFERHFAGTVDPFLAEALQYVDACYRVLGRGVDVSVNVIVKRPEISGEDTVAVAFQGRVGDASHIERLVTAGLGGCERWDGNYA